MNPIIANLNPYIAMFSSCLLHLINHQGVNLPPLENPIVLSRYVYLLEPSHFSRPSEQYSYLYMDTPNYLAYPVEYLGDSVDARRRRNETLESALFPRRDRTVTYRAWRCTSTLYLFPPPIQGYYENSRMYKNQGYPKCAKYYALKVVSFPCYLH